MAKDKNSLLERLKKNSTLTNIAVLAESKIFNEKPNTLTDVYLINAALSGDMDLGMYPGLLHIVGGSRMFKSGFMLLMLRAFQRTYPAGIALFYDSEFGSPESYFDAFEIDKQRVLHCPITNVEMMKFDVAKQLDEITDKDNVWIGVDSIGSLASKKEAEDALEGKSVADMSRAKALNSFARIITPHLTLKSIYMAIINHGYKEQGLFPKTIVGGGEKLYLASDNVWIISREIEKDGDDFVGHTFKIKIEKSRYSKEKTILPVRITFDGGIDKFSGLLEFAIESGHVKVVKAGGEKTALHARVNTKTGEIYNEELTAAYTNNQEFWDPILADETFKEFIRATFRVAYGALLPTYEPNVTEE